MFKNLNDYLSLITLIFFSITGLGIFISIFTTKENIKIDEFNFLKELTNYIDNTEE